MLPEPGGAADGAGQPKGERPAPFALGIPAYFEMEASLAFPKFLDRGACSRYTKVCSTDSERLAWKGGPPSQPAPPPMLEGTNTITWYRAVPTGIAAFVFAASLILWQHLKRRRLHQRISTRV